ncbi:DUF3261 domain-containing protein [Nannocystis bainbridge]|uniref:DUF3261 domain-containing protein n=1 Tax=Nannocystis bainbridge TaxID=2995303 RepID=A0ABT5E1A6_9BACT|nr:DUF3261 domain-containing protein [Nannocystis bainbridge]MDC0719210.1 DUF3261 domain-containing protein [Nannocystis bainbridge]
MLIGACAKGQASGSAAPPELKDADYPGALATTLAGPDFMARQRLRGTARGREFGGEVVLQKQGDGLTLIGLTPFSTKAFVAKQQGAAVQVDVFAPEGKLPFPPRFMLLDVHRVQFLGLPGAPLADGTHAGEVGEEAVTEVWQGGALLERRFERKDGKPAGTIVVTYEGGMKDGALPARLKLVNGWFGYEIAVETLQWQPL